MKLSNFYYPNFDSTPEILQMIMGATGKNPLELVNFVKYNADKAKLISQKFKIMLKNYMNKRFEEIFQDHAIFYAKNMENNAEKLEKFLGYFLKMVSHSEEVNKNNSYELYIDKKYIYIDEGQILRFICPIAKRVFIKFYINKIPIFPTLETKILTSIPTILENSALNQSGKGNLFEFFIVSIMQQNINKKFTLQYSKFSEKMKKFEQNNLTLEYKEWKYLSSQNLEEIKNLEGSCLLVPMICNFYAIDLIYWENSTKIFYAFQCTIKLISQDRSDVKFNQSEFYTELLKAKKESIIQFIWICGPSSLTLDQVENEFQKKRPLDKKNGFLFPNKNAETFKNLNTY